MARRGHCKKCMKNPHDRPADAEIGIYRNGQNKWCSVCSRCKKEQAYTRKNHARQSQLFGWQCKACRASEKRLDSNRPVGNKRRYFRRYRKGASLRQIDWALSEKEMFEKFDGSCEMTGWEISLEYEKGTASLDRIDSSKGYEPSNIQWVHKMVNMCKNRYSIKQFVDMCRAIVARIKK